MNIKDEVYIKNEICFTRIGPLPVPCVNVKVIYDFIHMISSSTLKNLSFNSVKLKFMILPFFGRTREIG